MRKLAKGWMVVGLLAVTGLFVPGAAGATRATGGTGETVGEAVGATAGATERSTANWVQMAAGANSTCATRTNGRLYCWGSDWTGAVGDGGVAKDRSAPREVAGGATDWVGVSVSWSGACGRRASGRLYCWGNDSDGQVGDGGTNTDQQAPVRVAGGRTDWASVSAGYLHTCARTTSGRLFCWGSDNRGQLGNGGANTSSTAPVEVAGGATDWASVSTGYGHTCGRRTSGRVFCWGEDQQGQLGNDPALGDTTTPVEVSGGATDWSSVVAGGFHSCGIKTSGRLYCWGTDQYGQLGNGGPNTSRATPGQVAGASTTWAQVSASFDNTCARKASRRIYCWGWNFTGQLGNGAHGQALFATTPGQVAGSATDWSFVISGGAHTCARKMTGRLYCWGYDYWGQLGNGKPNADVYVPVQVA